MKKFLTLIYSGVICLNLFVIYSSFANRNYLLVFASICGVIVFVSALIRLYRRVNYEKK